MNMSVTCLYRGLLVWMSMPGTCLTLSVLDFVGLDEHVCYLSDTCLYRGLLVWMSMSVTCLYRGLLVSMNMSVTCLILSIWVC